MHIGQREVLHEEPQTQVETAFYELLRALAFKRVSFDDIWLCSPVKPYDPSVWEYYYDYCEYLQRIARRFGLFFVDNSHVIPQDKHPEKCFYAKGNILLPSFTHRVLRNMEQYAYFLQLADFCIEWCLSFEAIRKRMHNKYQSFRNHYELANQNSQAATSSQSHASFSQILPLQPVLLHPSDQVPSCEHNTLAIRRPPVPVSTAVTTDYTIPFHFFTPPPIISTEPQPSLLMFRSEAKSI